MAIKTCISASQWQVAISIAEALGAPWRPPVLGLGIGLTHPCILKAIAYTAQWHESRSAICREQSVAKLHLRMLVLMLQGEAETCDDVSRSAIRHSNLGLVYRTSVRVSRWVGARRRHDCTAADHACSVIVLALQQHVDCAARTRAGDAPDIRCES